MNPLSLSLSNSEQYKIATFLTLIDQKIENITKIINCFIKIKKYFLNNLFVNKNNKVPALRFPGFKGEWRYQKLSQISRKVTNKNINCQCRLILINSAAKGLIAQLNSNKINLNKYLMIKKYDFCYDPTPTKNYPYGPINQLEKYEEGIVSPIYICFRLVQHQNLDSVFFKYFFQTNKWYHHIYLVGNKGVRKLIGVKSDDFFKMLLYFPNNIHEQIKISEFLNLIDQKIENIKQQKNCLEQYRSYLLKNMFV